MIFDDNDVLLMIGDSITDCGRTRLECPGIEPSLGNGYVSMVAATLTRRHPAKAIRIINRGNGGDTSRGLVGRWQRDVLDLGRDPFLSRFGECPGDVGVGNVLGCPAEAIQGLRVALKTALAVAAFQQPLGRPLDHLGVDVVDTGHVAKFHQPVSGQRLVARVAAKPFVTLLGLTTFVAGELYIAVLQQRLQRLLAIRIGALRILAQEQAAAVALHLRDSADELQEVLSVDDTSFW